MREKSSPPDWLPDWRDVSQYPNPYTSEPRQLAWEFLRRNPEYQNDYKDPYLHPPKYGLQGLSSPPSDNNPFKDFLFNFIPLSRIVYDSDDSGSTMVWFEENELAIIFDLSKSISSQISEAKRQLQLLQKTSGLKGKQTRPPYDRIIRHLRILDAVSSGATHKEIATVLFPETDNEYPDYLGNDMVKKNIKQAQMWRDEGYKYIVKSLDQRGHAPRTVPRAKHSDPEIQKKLDIDWDRRNKERFRGWAIMFKKQYRFEGRKPE